MGRSPESIFQELILRTPSLTPDVVHRIPLCASIEAIESIHVRSALQLLNDDFETCLRTISVHHESDELLQYITAVCLRRMLEIDACARIFKELLANKNLLLNEIYLPPLTYKKFLDRLIELEISDNLIIRQQLEAIQFTELKTLYEHAITI